MTASVAETSREVVVLPLVRDHPAANHGVMELLVLLVAIALVNLGLWLGWGTDTREPDNNWHPSTERRKDRSNSADVLLGTRGEHVLAG